MDFWDNEISNIDISNNLEFEFLACRDNQLTDIDLSNNLALEGFGIRLEDDVVIQMKGEPFNLMQNIPIEVAEIEDIMN